jgi:hypothetical protein
MVVVVVEGGGEGGGNRYTVGTRDGQQIMDTE